MALRALALAFIAALTASLLWAAERPKPADVLLADLLARPEQISELLASKKISPNDVPNPHWREDACRACHRATPNARNAALRNRDINQLCKTCHDGISAHNYIHAVGMEPSQEKRNRMNESLRQALKRGGGVITCISCHDLGMQCHKERFAQRADNPRFFRGGPFEQRTDLCYSCHNPTHYERLNPHDQINDEGELRQQVCLVCHDVVPNRREVKSINDVSFNVTQDLTQLCTGCHPWVPHPAAPMMSRLVGNNHLLKPSLDVEKHMKKTETERNMILPVDPSTGKISCATCHNPHERGVQVFERADRGADGIKRLRAGAPGDVMCLSCHDI